MADEMELRRKAENLFLNGQIEHAKATLIEGLKVYPESIAIQDLLHKYQDIKPINIEQENEKVKQCKIQNERELDQIIKNHKMKQDIGEINEKNHFNANSSFQKRITTLIMELNELIHNENDTWKKIHTIEMCIGTVYTALDLKNFEKAENELLIAESLSTELMKKIKKANDSEIDQNIYSTIANNTFKMRLKVLNMEKNILKNYSAKQLIKDEKDIWLKIESMEKCIGVASTVLTINNFEKAENELLKAETLSTELMEEIKNVLNINTVKQDVQKPEEDEQVPDCGSKMTGIIEDVISCILNAKTAIDNNKYDRAESLLLKTETIFPTKNARDLLKRIRAAKEPKQNSDPIEISTDDSSIVMVRGTKEDVSLCILKAKTALDNNKFDRAESLLLKAERIFPTKNSRDLLKQIQAAREPKDNPDPIVIATEAVEEVDTIKEEESKLGDESVSTVRHLTAFERAFNTGNFDKAERMLNKAKRLDPELNIERKLSQVKAAINKKNIEGKQKEQSVEIVNTAKEKEEESKSESEGNSRNAVKCLRASEEAFTSGNFVKAERLLYKARKFDPSLEVEKNVFQFKTAINEKIVEEKRMLNLEPELSTIRGKMASTRSKGNKDTDKTELEKTVEHRVERLVKKARQCINNSEFELAKATLVEAASIHATSTVKSLMEEIEKALENLKRTNYSSKCKGDVKTLISLAEKAVDEKNLEDAMNFLNSAEELYPTDQAKELIKSINEIKISRDETSVKLNCHEFTIEANESDRAEALKCVAIAEVAFREGRNERAEHFLVKALRICDIQTANSFLETVRNAKGQNNSSVKTEKSCEYGYDHSLNEYNLEYNKSIELAVKAMAEGDLDKAERFLSKAIRIYPNDKARKQLEHIKNVRSSQPSSDKTLKSDDYLKSEGEAEIIKDLAIKAMTCEVFDLACFYLEWALEKQPNEHTRELLQVAKIKQNSCNRRSSLSKNSIQFDANKLLDKAENLIRDGDLKKAETFLIVSWDIDSSRRTTSVHKKFLEARLARFERDEKHKRDGTNNGNSKNIFNSDKLVNTALERIGKKNFEEAKGLLMRAAEFYPSERIDKLLVEIGGVNTEDETLRTIYNSCKNYVRNKVKILPNVARRKDERSKKCIEIAENAISIENFVKAKRMLSKAERIHPTDTAQQLLKRIERLTLNNNNNEDENDVMAAQKCITIARIAIGNNNVVKAERFLLKSINIHSTDEAKELLEKLKNRYECNEPTKPTGTLETAEECIERAQNAFHEGNCKKALRLLTKSERIYPTSRAKDLLKQVKEKLSENGDDPDEVLKEVIKITVRKDAGAPPPPQPKKREVTSEQISEIQRVKQAKDDYDILGIPRGSDLNEVKKAYKYLTKVLHPDKNRAPGAKEAFMMAKEATDRLKLKLKSRK